MIYSVYYPREYWIPLLNSVIIPTILEFKVQYKFALFLSEDQGENIRIFLLDGIDHTHFMKKVITYVEKNKKGEVKKDSKESFFLDFPVNTVIECPVRIRRSYSPFDVNETFILRNLVSNEMLLEINRKKSHFSSEFFVLNMISYFFCCLKIAKDSNIVKKILLNLNQKETHMLNKHAQEFINNNKEILIKIDEDIIRKENNFLWKNFYNVIIEKLKKNIEVIELYYAMGIILFEQLYIKDKKVFVFYTLVISKFYNEK